MSKTKKIGKFAVSCAVIAFLGVNIVQAAGTSTVQLHSGNLKPVGSTITAASRLTHDAQNNGTINFYAYAMQEKFGFDGEISKQLMTDYADFYNSYSISSGKYYTKGEWSGEAGAAYISGYSRVVGN
ncbi:hypothetical protein ACFVAD_07680 [Sutcliffiella sp. NPDC057660]|uniref:hypothetical protein n=1 Tax=Sutcliffiella sp. NPDC057660 TaxID=3346199 RepID=UPI00368AA0C5